MKSAKDILCRRVRHRLTHEIHTTQEYSGIWRQQISFKRLWICAASLSQRLKLEISRLRIFEAVEYVLHGHDSRYEDIIEITQIFCCVFVLGRQRSPRPRGEILPLTCGSSTLLNTINRGRHSTLRERIHKFYTKNRNREEFSCSRMQG